MLRLCKPHFRESPGVSGSTGKAGFLPFGKSAGSLWTIAVLILLFQTGCVAVAVLPDSELSLPPQVDGERNRILQLNLLHGRNDFGLINVGAQNESYGSILSLGGRNLSALSVLNIGVVNQAIMAGLNLGLYNESAASGTQIALFMNQGFSYLNVAPINRGAGVQLGLANFSDSAIQIGLINFCGPYILPLLAYCDSYSGDSGEPPD